MTGVQTCALPIYLGDALGRKEPYEQHVDAIMERFSEIITGLGIPAKIEQEIRGSIDAILTNGLSIDEKLEDLKAIGEDGSAKIVSAYLNLIGLEATYVNPRSEE